MSGGGRVSTGRFGAWCVATLCLAGFGGAPVLAAESAYWAGYSLAYDSNINRVPTGALADFTQSLFGGVSYQERSADMSARILAEVERRNYHRNTYSDENLYTVNGAAVWTILPRQFFWTVEDVARQVQIDITTPATPSNRTNANSLSTGPDYTLRLNPVNTVAIGARYGRFDVDGPGDNQSYSAYARWLHPLSAMTTLSANYEATRVNFPDGSSEDFLRENWFLGYDTRASFGTVAIAGGTSRVTRKGAEEQKGRYARLSLWHPITSTSSLQAAFAAQYWDTGSQLVGGVTSATQPTGGAPSRPPSTPSSTLTPTTIGGLTTDTYYSERGDITYENRGGRFVFVLRGYANRVDYTQQPLDNDERGGRIEFTWLYSQARILTYAEYLKRAYRDFFQEDKARNIGVAMTYSLNRNLNMVVEGARLEQISTAAPNNYVDRRALLRLIYSSSSITH